MDGQRNVLIYSIAPVAGLARFARELSLTLSPGKLCDVVGYTIAIVGVRQADGPYFGTQSFVDERAAPASSGLEAHRGPAPAPSPNLGPSPALSDRLDRGEPARARDQADELGTLPDAVSGRSRI